MHWLALCGALALAGGTFLQADAGAPDPQQGGEADDLQIETLETDNDRFRRMTVPVTISGQGPFEFMVDTGAQATVLSAELAEQLQLHDRESATLVGMASARTVETTMVPDFSLGSRTFTIRVAPIVQGSNIGGADGILGLDSLQNQRVLLDFARGEMTISDTFAAGGASSYDIVVRARERLGQLIIHSAEVDGVRTAVIIDTGAQSSVGNPALQERMRRREALDNAEITDVNGVRLSGETRVARRINLDRAQLVNIPISFADSPTFHVLGLTDRPAMIMGMEELRLFRRVAIDFRSQRVLFDIPGDLPFDQSWRFNDRATRLD